MTKKVTTSHQASGSDLDELLRRRMTGFRNESLLELRRSHERERLMAALAELDVAPPVAVPVIVHGEHRLDPTLASIDPGSPHRVVVAATVASGHEVSSAVTAAAAAARGWGETLLLRRRARRAAQDQLGGEHHLAYLGFGLGNTAQQ